MSRTRSQNYGVQLLRVDKIGFYEGVVRDLERFESFVAPLDSVIDERDEYGGRDTYLETYKLIGIKADGSEEELGDYANGDSVTNMNQTGTKMNGNSPSALRFTLRSPTIELDNYEIFI